MKKENFVYAVFARSENYDTRSYSSLCEVEVEGGAVAGGGDAGLAHEVLAVDLAALQLRGGPGGPDDSAACLAEGIDDTGDERRFRADDGEVDVERFGQRQQGGRIRGTGEAFRNLGDAGIAGGSIHLFYGRAPAEPPRDGVFAAAPSDDQGLQ